LPVINNPTPTDLHDKRSPFGRDVPYVAMSRGQSSLNAGDCVVSCPWLLTSDKCSNSPTQQIIGINWKWQKQ